MNLSSHFNLIISEDSDLAKLGCLSDRFGVGPLGEKKQDSDESEIEVKGNKPEENDLKKIKKELKTCKLRNELIENEYMKCEKVIRSKTEEVEKLKLEIKDLRQIINLRNKKNDGDSYMDIEEDTSEEEFKTLFEMKGRGFRRANPQADSIRKTSSVNRDYKCKVCDFIGSSETHLSRHINVQHHQKENGNKEKEDEFNCAECDYQGYTEIQLRKHISLKHMVKDKPYEGAIKCRICEERFHEKWDLMKHRKTNHFEAVAPCRKFANSECGFTDVSCWWKHTDMETENMQCFTCGRMFNSKLELMCHKKNSHGDKVQPCMKYLKGICIFQSKYCWYAHETKDRDQCSDNFEDVSDKAESMEKEDPSVFRENINNLKPPAEEKGERCYKERI